MVNEKTQRNQKTLLIVVSIGLTPIALSYGLMPALSLDFLLGIEVNDLNLVHILRAVMGLYLALVLFWILGAVKSGLREPALYSMVVFMYGLAAGRLISLVADGLPHLILIVYLVLELCFGTLALLLVRKN